MTDVVVDTDVASAILKGQLPDSLRRRLAGQRLAVTFVTVGELTQWTYLHRWGPRRRADLRAFFASVVVLHCTFQAATVGRDSGPGPTPRSPAADQRLLDRRLLHRPRATPRHAQHQGLHRLRSRPRHPRHCADRCAPVSPRRC